MMQVMKQLPILFLLIVGLSVTAQDATDTTDIDYTPPSTAQTEEVESIMVRPAPCIAIETLALDFPDTTDIGITSHDIVNGVTTYTLIARMGTNALVEEISKQLDTQGWAFSSSAPRASRGTRGNSRIGAMANNPNQEKHFYACGEDTQRLVLELAPIGRSFRYTVRIYVEDIQAVVAPNERGGRSSNER